MVRDNEESGRVRSGTTGCDCNNLRGMVLVIVKIYCTRGRGEVLEQIGRQMSVRGTKKMSSYFPS